MNRRWSLFESVVNISIGYGIAYGINFYFLPVFGLNATPLQLGGISLIYVGASLVRSYTLRRIFERIRNWREGHGY